MTPLQRAIEVFTATLGQPRTLSFIALVVLAWAVVNATVSHPPDPPPFFWLQGTISLAALLTTTLILITRNRQTREAEQRDQLDLQVNLVTEQKITKVIELIEELRRDIPTVKDRIDPAVESMKASVDASAVLTALEETLETSASETDADSAAKPQT